MQYSTKTKYSVMGGVLQGTVVMKYENKEFTFTHVDKDKKEKMELRVFLNPGQKLEIEGKKNGVSMWTYSTLRKTISNANTFDLTFETDMTLSSQSVLYTLLDKYYAYGAFNVRRNEIRIFVDKQNRNLLLPKFLIDVKLYKEGQQVVTLKIDSRTSPYTFFFKAPNVFDRWNINMDHIEGTMNHVLGKSIKIETNLGGGIEIEGQRGDNSKGGRDIHILTKKAGKQMMMLTSQPRKLSTTMRSSWFSAILLWLIPTRPSTEELSKTTDCSLPSTREPESLRSTSTSRLKMFCSTSSP